TTLPIGLYLLSLHDALPISARDPRGRPLPDQPGGRPALRHEPLDPHVLRAVDAAGDPPPEAQPARAARGRGRRRRRHAALLLRADELRARVAHLALQRRRPADGRVDAAAPAAGVARGPQAAAGRWRLPDPVRDPAAPRRAGDRAPRPPRPRRQVAPGRQRRRARGGELAGVVGGARSVGGRAGVGADVLRCRSAAHAVGVAVRAASPPALRHERPDGAVHARGGAPAAAEPARAAGAVRLAEAPAPPDLHGQAGLDVVRVAPRVHRARGRRATLRLQPVRGDVRVRAGLLAALAPLVLARPARAAGAPRDAAGRATGGGG